MRKDWKMRITADRRGKITTGMKGVSSKGKEIPKSLDYFNISKFPELIGVYGEKPEKLIVMFPGDNIDEFFQTEYSTWATSSSGDPWKKRSCDGETCHHHVPETLMIDGASKVFQAGGEHECFKCYEDNCVLDSDSRCRAYTGFSAFILDPREGEGKIILPRPYRFQTNSVNSSDNLITELFNIFNNFGGLNGIPFVLSVKMTESQVPDGKGGVAKRKFPIWDIQAYGSVAMINMFRERKQLPTRDENAIVIDEGKMLVASTQAQDKHDGKDDDIPPADNSTAPKEPAGEASENVTDVNVIKEEEEKPDKDERPSSADTPDFPDPLENMEHSVLTNLPEIDLEDSIMLIGFVSKMILHMTDQETPKARKLLKKISKDPDTGVTYEKTADLKGLPNLRLRGIFAKTKSEYRKFLTKIIADEQQDELPF